jgi:Lrp/AsnC family transcriptional regulator for asnA, asnC and gidA
MEPPQGTLDELDFTILGYLQKDGRRSFTDIANELGMSVGAIRNRVGRLIEDKTLLVIGRVDPNRAGFHAYASIYIAVRPANLINAVAAELARLPEVSFLVSISGDYDLEVNVMCRNNDHLSYLTEETIHKIAGVHHTKTTMYLKVIKWGQPDLSLLQNGRSHPDRGGKQSDGR